MTATEITVTDLVESLSPDLKAVLRSRKSDELADLASAIAYVLAERSL